VAVVAADIIMAHNNLVNLVDPAVAAVVQNLGEL
jgi:hypothetical protein|tara:strand:+ start:424 stop:525 length:102 start_codon:yes stop_codon:yes gene_type:complete